MKIRISMLLAAFLTIFCVAPGCAEELISEGLREEYLEDGPAFALADRSAELVQVGDSADELPAVMAEEDGKTPATALELKLDMGYSKSWTTENYLNNWFNWFTVTQKGSITINVIQPVLEGTENLKQTSSLKLSLFNYYMENIWTKNTPDSGAYAGTPYSYTINVEPGTYFLNVEPRFVPKSGEVYTTEYAVSFTADSSSALAKPVITGCYNSVKGADIRWKKVEGAKSYQIWRKRAAEGTILADVIPVPESDPDVIQYFDPYIRTGCWGRVYNYYIVALRDGAKSPKSEDVVLQRLAPMFIDGSWDRGYGSIELNWRCTVSENKAKGYEVQYAASTADLYGQKGTFKKVTVNGRNNVNKTITGLPRGHMWYFRVRCYVNYTHSVTGKTTKTWSQYSDVVSVYAG